MIESTSPSRTGVEEVDNANDVRAAVAEGPTGRSRSAATITGEEEMTLNSAAMHAPSKMCRKEIRFRTLNLFRFDFKANSSDSTQRNRCNSTTVGNHAGASIFSASSALISGYLTLPCLLTLL